ncbi:hypothetical protein GCM10007989_08880 [Devosia pacifica]|uniref:Uncharacterized protein n=1 Tax=Devosia pacifica TaxID=1335967 RepID=A0A918RY71_9HYPH|nr:hypothetical protein [Devosia pacifica]GHA16086.1 hypothetical protein GCM10007989_08880 [Devosia pacifica]
MSTKELDFKQRMKSVLQDLESRGRRDPEAMWLLGGIASGLAREFGVSNWTLAKRRISRQTYDVLIDKFQEEGNHHHREGRIKQAYAIQALALSLIAPTQPDLQVRQGGHLLDQLIDRAILFYRQGAKSS